MSERLILFRYHTAFDVCASRLEQLREFNPGKKICGLYGGPQEDLEETRSLPLDSFYAIPIDDPWWKWVNGDLCVRWWFRDVGHQFSFDFVHVIEWDMLLLGPIDELFGHVGDGIALSVLRWSGEFDHEDLLWTAAARGAWELDALHELLRERYAQEVDTHWAGFGGAVLSREFLERYAEDVVPSYCNDEIRVSGFAQAYGMKVHDTQLVSAFFGMNHVVDQAGLEEGCELGVRAFHRVRFAVPLPSDIHTPGKWVIPEIRKATDRRGG